MVLNYRKTISYYGVGTHMPNNKRNSPIYFSRENKDFGMTFLCMIFYIKNHRSTKCIA